jgi:hypothetical protein
VRSSVGEPSDDYLSLAVPERIAMEKSPGDYFLIAAPGRSGPSGDTIAPLA